MTNDSQALDNESQPWDVQTSGRLLLALNETAGASPTPQQIVDAIGTTLSLDACGIFPTRGEEDAPIAVYFRTDELRDAFVQAYTEQAVGVETVRQMPVGGETMTMVEWDGANKLPSYVMDRLSDDSWATAIELYHDTEVAGLLWAIGTPDQDARSPSKELVQSIASLASLALQQTVGRAWALSEADELKLVEELSSILTQDRPLSERLQEVAVRAQEASGFTSVGLAAEGVGAGKRKNTAAFAVDEAAYSREYVEWALEYFASDEAVDETKRFFEGRGGPLLFANPAQLSTVDDPSHQWLLDNEIRFLVQIPLRYADEFLGTLRICSAFSETETWERLRVFTALAGHMAAILKSLLLFDQVQQAHTDLTLSHYATVRTLAYAAEARDPFTGEHLKNIEAYTTALGQELELSADEIEALRFGAILHDVGKLRVPDSILLKPGKLDDEEWAIIRQHPLFGEEILMHSNIPRVALQIARWHHERWDGKGYPDGISGDAIPLAVQIVTVADVFDALTSTRPYKDAWPADQAMAEIAEHCGLQFAPRVVGAFRSLYQRDVIRDILASKVAAPATYPAKQAAA